MNKRDAIDDAAEAVIRESHREDLRAVSREEAEDKAMTDPLDPERIGK